MAELEALAVTWAIKKCAFFLDGLGHFTVVTDSSPLVPIFNKCTYAEISNDHLMKMKTLTARYTFTVRWQPCKRQMASNALS